MPHAVLGFPVALKAIAPGLVHKSDVGGVRLDLHDEQAVAEAYRQMQDSVGDTMIGALVQPMVAPGLELIVGVHHDVVVRAARRVRHRRLHRRART